MAEFAKAVMLTFTQDTFDWLDQKASVGYKKSTVLRLILTDYMNADTEQAGAAPTPGR